jgi:uncharacterized protein (UPF0335 family)
MQPEKVPGGVAAEQLRSIISRIERLDDERKALGEDRKEIMQEARSAGFDLKAIRALLKERKQDEAEREELEALVETYRRALGSLASTPLGEAAIRRVA